MLLTLISCLPRKTFLIRKLSLTITQYENFQRFKVPVDKKELESCHNLLDPLCPTNQVLLVLHPQKTKPRGFQSYEIKVEPIRECIASYTIEILLSKQHSTQYWHGHCIYITSFICGESAF
jgi:hypothetical protein